MAAAIAAVKEEGTLRRMSAGNNRDHGSLELKHASDIASVNPKTPDSSAHLEVSVRHRLS